MRTYLTAIALSLLCALPIHARIEAVLIRTKQ